MMETEEGGGRPQLTAAWALQLEEVGGSYSGLFRGSLVSLQHLGLGPGILMEGIRDMD